MRVSSLRPTCNTAQSLSGVLSPLDNHPCPSRTLRTPCSNTRPTPQLHRRSHSAPAVPETKPNIVTIAGNASQVLPHGVSPGLNSSNGRMAYLRGSVVAFIANAHELERLDVRVANDALAIALLAEPPNCCGHETQKVKLMRRRCTTFLQHTCGTSSSRVKRAAPHRCQAASCT